MTSNLGIILHLADFEPKYVHREISEEVGRLKTTFFSKWKKSRLKHAKKSLVL